MKNVFFKFIFFCLLISNSLYADPILNAIEIKKQDDKSSIDIEKELIIQNKELEKVITNINNESYLKSFNDEKELLNKIDLITNKININKKQKNTLAVRRDQLKLQNLKEQVIYQDTLINLIKAKQEFKDKQYFQNILTDAIKKIEKNSIDSFTPLYESEQKENNSISNEFKKNYIELYNQKFNRLFILKNLLKNITKFRKSNFFIDEFNIQYFIKKIDSLKGVSFISTLTTYYLNFSIGEIIVVLFILLFFKLVNTKIVLIIVTFISKLFVRSTDEDSEVIREYLRLSVSTPLIFALYTFAIHISIFILIKDTQLIDKMLPWINTLYMAFLTWAIYSVLNNSINIYAHNLLEKYPNVRKEMIVFILRIIKVILILFVIIFLFAQLGIDIKAIAASLGVGGIAIALASKDTLANFFGSLNIMTDNSFSQGDWIKANDIEGTVVDIRMRTTRIRTFENAMITVPNSQLANTHITNWSKRIIGRRIKMSIGITYESKMSDIKNLKDDIYQMLNDHPDIATERNSIVYSSKRFEAIKREDLQGIKKTLLVYIDEFSNSSINILVYCFSRSPDWQKWLETKEDVIMKISELAKKNNCEFAYPTQALWLKR